MAPFTSTDTKDITKYVSLKKKKKKKQKKPTVDNLGIIGGW